MEDYNDKINAALEALLDDNSVKFDELVADIIQDKVSTAVEAKREEYKQVAFAEPIEDETVEEETSEVQEEE